MYTGGYHRACLQYALSLAPRENVFILSGKHGLLRLDDRIEPYEQRVIADREFWKTVWPQLEAAGITGHELVLICGADYYEYLQFMWQHNGWPVSAPLAGVGGIGKQLAWLKAQSIGTPTAA